MRRAPLQIDRAQLDEVLKDPQKLRERMVWMMALERVEPLRPPLKAKQKSQAKSQEKGE